MLAAVATVVMTGMSYHYELPQWLIALEVLGVAILASHTDTCWVYSSSWLQLCSYVVLLYAIVEYTAN